MEELSKQQIEKVESSVLSLAERANGFIVENEIDAEVASDFLRNIKDTEKKIEDKRLEFTTPLNQSLNAINATFKNLKAPLAVAKKIVMDKILSWRSIEAEKIRKAEEEARKVEAEKIRKIQEALKAEGDAKKKQEMIEEIIKTEERPIIEKQKTTIGNTQARKIWTYEVVDFSKVPDKYKEISKTEINASIRAGERNIDGLRIYQKEILSIV